MHAGKRIDATYFKRYRWWRCWLQGVPVTLVLARWCHWEQVHSWPPICVTGPQWWCWTAGVCGGSPRDCDLSLCCRMNQDAQKHTRNISVYICIYISNQQSLTLFLSVTWQQHDERTWWTQTCQAVVYSHSSHPLITECHKGDAQPPRRDAVLLCIKLVCSLLLQLTVVLFCIHLQGWKKVRNACSHCIFHFQWDVR